jgi:hypothetical protein
MRGRKESMDAQHTPMSQHGTVVYVPGGGFDVRNCPHADELAEFISRACNAHDQLVAALRTMLALDEEYHQREPGDDDVCAEVREARAAVAKATVAPGV